MIKKPKKHHDERFEEKNAQLNVSGFLIIFQKLSLLLSNNHNSKPTVEPLDKHMPDMFCEYVCLNPAIDVKPLG